MSLISRGRLRRQPDYREDAMRPRERLLEWMRETADPVRRIYERSVLEYGRW